MRKFNVRFFEQSGTDILPLGVKIDKSFTRVSCINVDECLRRAREIAVKELHRKVRKISIGPAGIFVILHPRGKAK